MTFKEAKDILKKEFAVIGLHKSTEPFEFDDSNWFGYEKPSVLEAFRVLAKEGYYVTISGHDYDMRKKRLQKEYEENTKDSGSDEEQPKGKVRIICCSASPKADFYYKHFLNEGNPALKEAASQFNDALLDEQAKKIEELTEENERLKDQVAVLYAYKENNEKYNLKQIKRLGKEISKLNGIIHDKNAVLADVAEELRLSKIREKNLTEVGQKYMKENEELKKELEAFKESYKRRLKEDSEHFEHIREICNAGLQKWLLESEYLEKDKPFRFSQLPELSEEEEKKLSLFRDDSVGAVTNQKDCSSAKDTHPTEDNPEQIEKDENLERVRNALEDGRTVFIGYDKAEEGGDHSAIISRCCKNIAISKDEAEIIERCTKNGTELHYSEKNGFTYTNMFGDEMPIICLRGMCQVFTDEEIKNMKK